MGRPNGARHNAWHAWRAHVTIRLAEADLDPARKQAEEEGLPYQTCIKSLLHEALVQHERRQG